MIPLEDRTHDTYTIFVERADSGANWGSWSPELNVYATGATQEAEDLIPEPSATAATVHAAA